MEYFTEVLGVCCLSMALGSNPSHTASEKSFPFSGALLFSCQEKSGKFHCLLFSLGYKQMLAPCDRKCSISSTDIAM